MRMLGRFGWSLGNIGGIRHRHEQKAIERRQVLKEIDEAIEERRLDKIDQESAKEWASNYDPPPTHDELVYRKFCDLQALMQPGEVYELPGAGSEWDWY
jgi:hypothetical protein